MPLPPLAKFNAPVKKGYLKSYRAITLDVRLDVRRHLPTLTPDSTRLPGGANLQR